MAREGVVTTGLKELAAGVRDLPRAVTLALRAVAFRSSRRVQADARRRLNEKTHGTGATAAAIAVVEDAIGKRFLVQSSAPSGRPANLPIWLEFGTIKMDAKPYMRPALNAESDAYRRESDAAALDAAHEVMR